MTPDQLDAVNAQMSAIAALKAAMTLVATANPPLDDATKAAILAAPLQAYKEMIAKYQTPAP